MTSSDDDGVEEGIQWCLRHLGPGDTLTVWTKLKSNLHSNRRLSELARRPNVDHVTGHGGAYLSGPGPVLMAWAHMHDIGELVRFGAEDITGLCVISWNVERLRPWVVAQRPEIVGDASDWEDLESAEIDPVVVEALERLTLTVTHNNTIAAGFEKDQVVRMLLLLRKHRYPMDPDAIWAWALAIGWSGDNPKRLAAYVMDINGGKGPQTRDVLRDDVITRLKRRADGEEDDGWAHCHAAIRATSEPCSASVIWRASSGIPEGHLSYSPRFLVKGRQDCRDSDLVPVPEQAPGPPTP